MPYRMRLLLAATLAAGTSFPATLPASTIVPWGDNSFGQRTIPPSATNVLKIACGREFSMAVREDGTVVAWGDNTYAQCNIPPGLSGVVDVVAGENHALALRSNGSVV